MVFRQWNKHNVFFLFLCWLYKSIIAILVSLHCFYFALHGCLLHICFSLPVQVGPSYGTGQEHFNSPFLNSHFPPFLQGFLSTPSFGKHPLSTKKQENVHQSTFFAFSSAQRLL